MIKTNLSALIANGKEDFYKAKMSRKCRSISLIANGKKDFYKAAGFYESITGLRARNDINVSA